jgi:hypothetical protein
MTITRGGDLQHAAGRTIYWHTRTHTPGSSAYLTAGGNLIIYSPRGRVSWQSHSGGHHGGIWLDFACGSLAIHVLRSDASRTVYHTKGGADRNC